MKDKYVTALIGVAIAAVVAVSALGHYSTSCTHPNSETPAPPALVAGSWGVSS